MREQQCFLNADLFSTLNGRECMERGRKETIDYVEPIQRESDKDAGRNNTERERQHRYLRNNTNK